MELGFVNFGSWLVFMDFMVIQNIQMSIANFGMENYSHQCQDCGMKFYNAQELVNHMRKFCTANGLNSLEGLAQYQLKTNIAKKFKNYESSSLGAMRYEPVFTADELAKQAKYVAAHKQQLSIHRPYSNANSKVSPQYNTPTMEAYQTSNVNQYDSPKENKRAAYGERVLAGSDISLKSLGNFTKQQQPIKVNNNANEPISTPSEAPFAFAKNRGPTVLDKSNSSIANMGATQRRVYANDKLLELEDIAAMYDKGGGINMDFRKNLDKMTKFYKKMLEDDLPTKKYPGQFAISRAQTPISRLDDLLKDEDNDTKQPKDALDQYISKKSQRKKKEQPNKSKQVPALDLSKGYPYPPMPYPYPYPPVQQQPQIIMIPPYPQQSQRVDSTMEQIKYFEKMMEVKNEENRKLMQMLLESKRERDPSQASKKIEQVRQSRISQLQATKPDFDNPYHMETPMDGLSNAQEKILLALQREQLDQLRLLASLPPELQEIKMQSVMKIIEQRTQMEKEILHQKVRRLEEQKKNQLYQEELKMEKDDWANEQRKRLIGYQMQDVLEEFKRKVTGQNSSDEDDEDDEEDQQDGLNDQDNHAQGEEEEEEEGEG